MTHKPVSSSVSFLSELLAARTYCLLDASWVHHPFGLTNTTPLPGIPPPSIHPPMPQPKATCRSQLPATRHHQVLPCPPPRQSWCCLFFCSSGSTRSSVSCSCGHSHTGQSELSGKQLPSCLIASSGSLLSWGWGLNCLPSVVDSVVLQPC